MKTRDKFTDRLVLALCALSGVTTGLGLWWIFDKNVELAGVSMIFAAAAAALLQALIVRFWDIAANTTSFARLTFGLLGATVSLLSAGFSAGSYILAINKSKLETHLTQQKSNTVMEPLAKVNTDLRGISDTMLDISNEANQKSRTESQYGGTCAGDKPEGLCGPRCRLRKRHAQESESLSAQSRSIAGEAIAIIAGLQTDQSREGMLRAFTAAQDVAHHPNLSRITTWLRQEIAGFNSEFIDPDTKRPFICRDPEMLKKMTKALDLLSKGLELPSVPPEPVAVGFRDAIGKSYQDAFELVGILFSGKIDPARHQALAYSYVGYAPALLIEIFIIALVLYRSSAQRHRGAGWTTEDEFVANVRDLPIEMRKRYKVWVDLILNLVLEERNIWYFARPLDGASSVVRECIEAALILKLPLDPDMRPAVPLDDLYPDWVETRMDIHRGARWFALHPLAKEKLEWLRMAARDLNDVEDDRSIKATPVSKTLVENMPEHELSA